MVKPPHIKRSEPPPPPDSPEGRARAERIKEYYKELGVLVSMFPAVEVSMFALLAALCGARRELALALFADVRIDSAMTTARRLLAAREEVFGKSELQSLTERWLHYAFDQLGIINGIRNQIIHHGLGEVSASFEKVTISNRFRARSEAHLTEIPISAEILRQMKHDAAIAGGIISSVTRALLSHATAATSSFQSIAFFAKEHPWQYKSPLQGGKKGKTPDSSPK